MFLKSVQEEDWIYLYLSIIASLFNVTMQRIVKLEAARLARVKRSFSSSHISSARYLWSTRTFVFDTDEALLEALPSVKEANQSTLVLFAISRNVPAPTLSKLVQHFQDYPTKAIGCLSYGDEGGRAPYTLSYALHKATGNTLEMAVPFRSIISGTPKISLGREVSRLEKNVRNTEWAGDASIPAELLPPELRVLEYVKQICLSP